MYKISSRRDAFRILDNRVITQDMTLIGKEGEHIVVTWVNDSAAGDEIAVVGSEIELDVDGNIIYSDERQLTIEDLIGMEVR